MKILINVIGHLMMMANREGVKTYWYELKSRLCSKYGVNDGYDLQHLAGKHCYSCDGTGVYRRYVSPELCWNCYHGWYKRPCYVLLERIRVGTYVFHKPIRREYSLKAYEETEVPMTVTIEGYINHSRHKYGEYALLILLLLFDRKNLNTYFRYNGIGWRLKWWLPRNWLYNAIHIYRKGFDAYPLQKLKQNTKRLSIPKHSNIPDTDDLPF